VVQGTSEKKNVLKFLLAISLGKQIKPVFFFTFTDDIMVSLLMTFVLHQIQNQLLFRACFALRNHELRVLEETKTLTILFELVIFVLRNGLS